VPAPYRTSEMACALIEAARLEGLPLRQIAVRPDEEARVWLIAVTFGSGEVRRLTFPFASARGIYTPAEIADRFLGGSWPFGQPDGRG